MNENENDAVREGGLSAVIELLGKWERTIAIALGLAAGGAGGVAVFITSNQAGTAVLLILSVAFCLIGVQGTPLLRLQAVRIVSNWIGASKEE